MLLKDQCRKQRLKLGYSKAELSRRTGGYVSASYIGSIEDGSATRPTIYHIIMLAQGLGMHVSDFVEPLQKQTDRTTRYMGVEGGVVIKLDVWKAEWIPDDTR